MALPNDKGAYDDFRRNVAYFSARLGANPLSAKLAPRATESLQKVKDAHRQLEDREEAELTARAGRDHIDGQIGVSIVDYRRELAGVTGPGHPILKVVFPEGAQKVVAPKGEEQVRRLEELGENLELVVRSPQLQDDPKKEKITSLLADGKSLVSAELQRLVESVGTWKAADVELDVAREDEQHAKAKAREEAGKLLGALREVLGGSASEADSYI